MYSFRNHSIINEPDHTQSYTIWHSARNQKPVVSTGHNKRSSHFVTPEIELNNLLINRVAHTCLMRIIGNDWRHLDIFDGDIILADRIVSDSDDDIVIWWHDGDFAISHRNRIPKGARIWGVVTSIIHQIASRETQK